MPSIGQCSAIRDGSPFHSRHCRTMFDTGTQVRTVVLISMLAGRRASRAARRSSAVPGRLCVGFLAVATVLTSGDLSGGIPWVPASCAGYQRRSVEYGPSPNNQFMTEICDFPGTSFGWGWSSQFSRRVAGCLRVCRVIASPSCHAVAS